jgi:hypothetical protein
MYLHLVLSRVYLTNTEFGRFSLWLGYSLVEHFARSMISTTTPLLSCGGLGESLLSLRIPGVPAMRGG